MRAITIRHPVRFALCILLYAAAVIVYACLSYAWQKTVIMQEIDKQLLLSAKALKYLLEPDFHDRALDKDSISIEEETRNRIAVSSFAAESGFKWVYTLVRKNDRYFFSAPTVTPEELRERSSWYFYPYDDIPIAFRQAFEQNKIMFAEYTDHWGAFRSVALPQTSPGGRRYLACADCEISHIEQLLKQDFLKSVGVAAFFFICAMPFILFFREMFRSHNRQLEAVNTELRRHKTNLELLVNERTAALEEEKNRLGEALATVNQLSGLLPICSSCKKIRDDNGYWNRLEKFIEDHSEAQFTHSICPECAKKLYPDLMDDA